MFWKINRINYLMDTLRNKIINHASNNLCNFDADMYSIKKLH